MQSRTEGQVLDLVARINEMQAKGFPASKDNLLPLLYVDVYGKMYRKDCGACIREAFKVLIRWADKQINNTNKFNPMSRYKFKREYHDKTVTFFKGGRTVRVTSKNINDEYAAIILSIPKYAHVLEVSDVAVEPEIPKAETPQAPVTLDVTDILNEVSPNVTQSGDASVSTSTGPQTDGLKPKAKPGPKAKSKQHA